MGGRQAGSKCYRVEIQGAGFAGIWISPVGPGPEQDRGLIAIDDCIFNNDPAVAVVFETECLACCESLTKGDNQSKAQHHAQAS